MKSIFILILSTLISWNSFAQDQKHPILSVTQDGVLIDPAKGFKNWNPVKFCWQTSAKKVESVEVIIGTGVVVLCSITYRPPFEENCLTVELNKIWPVNKKSVNEKIVFVVKPSFGKNSTLTIPLKLENE